MMRRLRRVTAVLVALLALALPPPRPAEAPAGLGVYVGAGAVAATDSVSTWLRRPVDRAMDFVDRERGWEAIAQPLWLLDTWGCWVRLRAGRQMVLSVPLLPSSAWGQLRVGAAGQLDDPFLRLARSMVDRGLGRSVVRLGWEANSRTHPWSAEDDPASYKQFFRRVVAVMRSVPGAAFTFDWTANAGIGGGSKLRSFDSFYPGDDVVDVIGLDVYDIKWQDTTSSPADRWDFTRDRPLGLAEHRAFALAHRKPTSYPEWAMYARGDLLGGGGDNPYFVDRMADWFTSTNVAYQAYFDVSWGGGTLSSFPQGRVRYRERFGRDPTEMP